MKKLTLDPDGLSVDTFEVDARGREARGTVLTFTCGDSHIRPCLAD